MKNYSKNLRPLKGLYQFVTRNNAVVIALELAIFAGVIFALAAPDEPLNSVEFTPLDNFTSIEQQNNGTTTSGQAMANNGNNELGIMNQEISPSENPKAPDPKLQEKYEQATEIKAKYRQEGSSLKRIVKDDPKDRIEIQIGDKDGIEFSPDLKIARWDDEVNMAIKPKALEGVAAKDRNLKFEGEKIKFETPDIDYHLYEMPIDATNTEGAFEYEVILKKKPATNIVEFSIGTQGLDFFYQPELTQQEIDEGAFRPENVIGSYAVYASENKTNYIGGKEYKSGKVGHIYRPKIIDSAGKEVWGILNVDTAKGILSVEIPQGFLDNAVYPVIVDPTFGYTTAGTAGMMQAGNYAFFAKGTPAEGDGTVDSITMSVIEYSSGSSTNVKGVIWLISTLAIITNGITPGTLITPGTPKNWRTINYSTNPSVTNNTNYYVGVIFQSSNSIYVYYDNGSTGDGGYDASSYSTPNLTAPLGNNTRKTSVYATYTAAGGGAEYQPRPGGVSPSGGGFMMF